MSPPTPELRPGFAPHAFFAAQRGVHGRRASGVPCDAVLAPPVPSLVSLNLEIRKTGMGVRRSPFSLETESASQRHPHLPDFLSSRSLFPLLVHANYLV